MKSILIVLLVCHLVSVAVALASDIEVCDATKDYLKVVRSSRSKAEDDAEAISRCPKNYDIVGCDCESFADDKNACDGSTIRSVADGEVCVAYNGAYGKGVVAAAYCARLSVTCYTDYKNLPQMRCPEQYRLISCSLHTYFLHKYDTKPTAIQDGGICRSSRICGDCRVTARCLRIVNFFEGVI